MSALRSGPAVPHPSHHPSWKVVGRAAAVVGGGVVLLNLAFGAYAAWFLLAHRAAELLTADGGRLSSAAAVAADLVVLGVWWVLVGAATVYALRRWPRRLGTAVWLAVPAASVLLPLGVALVASPTWVVLTGGGAAVAAVIALMVRAHAPWEQVLAVAWVAAALALMTLAGIDI